jgi:hypothetical protein
MPREGILTGVAWPFEGRYWRRGLFAFLLRHDLKGQAVVLIAD